MSIARGRRVSYFLMTTLENIRQKIISDPASQWATDQGWEPVYRAHKDARILIIGQAPGRLAQGRGVPWDDPSGRNLRKWMNMPATVFYNKRRVALVPMDFYFPGSKERGDNPPRPEFSRKWHGPILGELENIKLTLLIGQYAHAYYLGKRRKKTLTETVRNWREYGNRVFPLVHPSPRNNIWQKKNPWFVEELLPELKKRVVQTL